MNRYYFITRFDIALFQDLAITNQKRIRILRGNSPSSQMRLRQSQGECGYLWEWLKRPLAATLDKAVCLSTTISIGSVATRRSIQERWSSSNSSDFTTPTHCLILRRTSQRRVSTIIFAIPRLSVHWLRALISMERQPLLALSTRKAETAARTRIRPQEKIGGRRSEEN